MANETGIGHRRTAGHFGLVECCVWESLLSAWRTSQSPTWQWPLPIEGDRPVRRSASAADFSLESDCLGVQSKVWGKLLISLNMTLRPIANKYGDGRLKRTLKREFNSTWNCVVVNGGFLEVSAVYSSRLRADGGGILGSWGRILGPAPETYKTARESREKTGFFTKFNKI